MSPFDVLDAKFVIELRDASMVPTSEVPEIAFAGRSNVGKSTLLNMLAQRHALARTSRTPGQTRGIVMFDLRFRSGVCLRLVDLPGFGFAERTRTERRAWGPLVETYLMNHGGLRGVMLLVDARRGPEEEELDLAEFLRAHQVPYLLVATKADKLSRADRGIALRRMAAKHRVRVYGASGVTRDGRDAIVAAAFAMAAGSAGASAAEPPQADGDEIPEK